MKGKIVKPIITKRNAMMVRLASLLEQGRIKPIGDRFNTSEAG